MPDYVYRGGSLSAFNEAEFATQTIEGRTIDIYKGRMDDPPANVTRGEPLSSLPWWKPEDMQDVPGWMVEQQGVTGGITGIITTALGFSGGVPMVLYLSSRTVNSGNTRYDYRFFNDAPGALAWIYNSGVTGEVHLQEQGLYGLVSGGQAEPVIERWGKEDLKQTSMQYENERELLAFTDSIDISRAMESVASFFSGPRSLVGSAEELTGRDFDDEGDAAAAVWQYATGEAKMDLPNYHIIVLNTAVRGEFYEIRPEWFEFAYDGQRVIEDYDAVPRHLFGGE